MTLTDLVTRLESTGLPVAFREFLEEDLPALPYITYSVGDTDIFFADGVPYFMGSRIDVVVHSKIKDLALEALLRRSLGACIAGWQEDANDAEDEYQYTITAYTAEESEEETWPKTK